MSECLDPVYQGGCHPCRMSANCERAMLERAEREGWDDEPAAAEKPPRATSS